MPKAVKLDRKEKYFIGTHANTLLREALATLGAKTVRSLGIPKRVRWMYDKDVNTAGFTNYCAEYVGKNALIQVFVTVDAVMSGDRYIYTPVGFGIDITDKNGTVFSYVQDPK